MPWRRLVREVGAAVERLALRGHEDGQRPATVAGHGLDGVHVDPVDVGPLLAVDLHVDEQSVHQVRGVVVLEGLVGHDVAPVAGRVADGDQHRPVLLAGPGEGLVAPRVPVDRVVGVLAQVRAGLGSEAVGHAAHRTDGAGGRPAQSAAKWAYSAVDLGAPVGALGVGHGPILAFGGSSTAGSSCRATAVRKNPAPGSWSPCALDGQCHRVRLAVLDRHISDVPQETGEGEVLAPELPTHRLGDRRPEVAVGDQLSLGGARVQPGPAGVAASRTTRPTGSRRRWNSSPVTCGRSASPTGPAPSASPSPPRARRSGGPLLGSPLGPDGGQPARPSVLGLFVAHGWAPRRSAPDPTEPRRLRSPACRSISTDGSRSSPAPRRASGGPSPPPSRRRGRR